MRGVEEARSRLRSCVSWTTNAAADELCCKLQTRYSKSCPLNSCYNVMLTKLYNVSVVGLFMLLHERRRHQIEVTTK